MAPVDEGLKDHYRLERSNIGAATADPADRPEPFLFTQTPTRLVGLRRSLVSATGEVLLTDQVSGTVYQITGQSINATSVLSAAQDIGKLGTTNVATGVFTPVVSGLQSPRGLAFLSTGLTVGPGYTVTPFAVSPTGASQPDSIAVDGANVWVGYQNGVAKDGSDGKSSTIVEYSSTGAVLQTFSVVGHNDGLKVDPTTRLVWALQNEDANPNLVIINPITDTTTKYTFATPLAGGGFDDITFLNGKVFLSESNPANNPNTEPAVVQVTLSGTNANVATVLLGNATATNAVTGATVTLNLQDPDSMTSDPAGDLVLDSQADNELVIIKNPGAANQAVTLLPLSDAANLLPGQGIDDTLFTPSASGTVLLTDQASGTVYRVTGGAIASGLVLSAAQSAGELGNLNTSTGLFTPVVSGLQSPRGLAFLSNVGASSVSPVVPVSEIFGPAPTTDINSAYVKGLYRSILGRDADATGLAFWVGQLKRRRVADHRFHGHMDVG